MLSPFVRAFSITSKILPTSPYSSSSAPSHSIHLHIHSFFLSVLLTTQSFIYLYFHHHFDCNLRAMNPVPANKKIIFYFPLIYYNFFAFFPCVYFCAELFFLLNCCPTPHIFYDIFSVLLFSYAVTY